MVAEVTIIKHQSVVLVGVDGNEARAIVVVVVVVVVVIGEKNNN